MAKNKKKQKPKRRRNPYHQVLRELFKPKTIPDKKKKKNKNKCRKTIKQGEAE
jgi:hypothetical protein